MMCIDRVFAVRHYAIPIMAFNRKEDALFQARIMGLEEDNIAEIPLYINDMPIGDEPCDPRS